MFKFISEIIAEILIILLSVMILKIYFETFFKQSKRKVMGTITWLIYIIWQIIVSQINVLPSYLNILISILLVSLICLSSYEAGFLQQIVFSVIINAIWMLAELMVGYIFISSGIHIYYSLPQFLGSVLSKLLTLILMVVLKKFFKNENVKNLSNKYNIIFLLIPIGSMYVVYNIFILSSAVNNNLHIRESLTSSLLILVINIVIFKLYINVSKEKELQKYNTVYEQQLELCNQHMKEKENVMMNFRNARHDMKQHFIVLMEMLENNESQLATEYLSKMVDMDILSNVGISKTDNIVVDSLLNAKYSVALKSNIKFEANIHIPMQLPFSGADISILLGNILDNAIEASLEIPEQDRYIKYYMKYEHNILIITVINAFNGVLIRNKSGKIVTNKGDFQNHGIGLESVRKVADKYHGSVVIEKRENTFIIKIILCDLSQKLHIIS